MRIERHFTKAGQSPYAEIEFRKALSEIKNPHGSVVFRLDDPSELEELGLESASDGVLLIEWPEKAGASPWPEALRLTLDFADAGARRLTASVPPSWQSRWPQT